VSRFREYRVSPRAIEQARTLGLTGDTEARVKEIARQAAAFTHPDGNWRFEGYVLWIYEGEIRSVCRLRRGPRHEWPREPLHTRALGCARCGGEMKVLVYEECDPCAGSRCSKCMGSGEVAVKRPCAAAQHPTMKVCPP